MAAALQVVVAASVVLLTVVEQAVIAGLVDLTDELQEVRPEKPGPWRKVGAIPELARARPSGDQIWGGSQMLWILVSVIVASIALYLIVHGTMAYNRKAPLLEVMTHYWLPGFVIALALGSILTRVTYRAFKRPRPH